MHFVALIISSVPVPFWNKKIIDGSNQFLNYILILGGRRRNIYISRVKMANVFR